MIVTIHETVVTISGSTMSREPNQDKLQHEEQKFSLKCIRSGKNLVR